MQAFDDRAEDSFKIFRSGAGAESRDGMYWVAV